MDPKQFDRLVQTLVVRVSKRPSRRALLTGLSGGLAIAGLGLLEREGVAKRKAAKKRNDNRQSLSAQKKRKKRKKRKGGGGGGGGNECSVTPPAPGSTFTVNGRDILDPNGNPVLLRGVNKMSVFDDEDPRGEVTFPEIAKTGANTVRIVWAIADDNGKTDPADLQALIDNAIAAGLLPMIELHDATGDWGRLDELVSYWTRPQIVEIIAARQNTLLVNIGNEVGDDTIGSGQFIDGYRKAVQALRCAGIHTPLVIDAPDFGKNLDVLNAAAATLLDADPERNLIFSVHLYWGIADGADAQFISTKLNEAVALNYPLIVGEFSKFGAFNGNDSVCAEGGRVDYQTIIQKTAELGIGWYAWEWGPGNDFGDPLCAVMDMTPDRLFANLKPGWATEVATTSQFSIKNTAKPIL